MKGPLALFFAAALLSAPASPAPAGEPEAPAPAPAPGIHWRLPREVGSEPVGNLKYGTLPYDLVVVDGRLLASVITPGQRSCGFFAQGEDGTLAALSPVSNANELSNWAVLDGKAVALVGGSEGIRAAVVSPAKAPDKAMELFDVSIIEVPENAVFGARPQLTQRYPVVSLAARENRLFAAFYRTSQERMRAAVSMVSMSTSDDGGKTWSEPVAVTGKGGLLLTDPFLALWTTEKKLHLVFAPIQDVRGSQPAPRHVVSADDGKTWQDGAALPAPSEGKKLYSARAFPRGKEIYLLANEAATGGKVSLYHSPDGGTNWDQPRPIADLRSKRKPAMSRCHLAFGEGQGQGQMIFGQGWVGSSRGTSNKGGGELLISEDGGANWTTLDMSQGLTQPPYCPRAALGPDGKLDAVFGWADPKNGLVTLLHRRGAPQAAAGADPEEQAAIAGMIERLADDDYRVREAAASALVRTGMAAVPALVAACKDPDPERSLTAEQLLIKINPPWWKGK